MKKKQTNNILAVVALAAWLCGGDFVLGAPAESPSQTEPKPSAAKEALFPDPVVARGKGFEIRQSELDQAFNLLKADAALNGRTIPEGRQRELHQAMLLDRLISTRLLVARATAADKARAAESAERFLTGMKQRMLSEEMFAGQLKAMGLTSAEFRERLNEQAICDEVVTRELTRPPTDDECRRFYEENAKMFEEPEKMKAAHILVSVKDPQDSNPNPALRKDVAAPLKEQKRLMAESLLARARRGEDFARLAKEFSDDPATRERGGEFTFARGQMAAEFETTAFSLGIGQISDLVTTGLGYHIIKAIGRIPAGKRPFEAAREEIRTAIRERQIAKRLPEFLQNLRHEANVQILDESLSPRKP